MYMRTLYRVPNHAKLEKGGVFVIFTYFEKPGLGLMETYFHT